MRHLTRCEMRLSARLTFSLTSCAVTDSTVKRTASNHTSHAAHRRIIAETRVFQRLDA